MKLKALVLTLFVAGLGASFALADDNGTVGTGSTSTATSTASEHHGKHASKHGSCHPAITITLKGSLVSVGADSFVLDVKRSNHHGLGLSGKPATIGVDAKTRIERHGHATLADLKVGDRLSVQARACKGADAASVQLVARKVDAHPAKDEAKAKDTDHSSTTTTTTTTATTSTK